MTVVEFFSKNSVDNFINAVRCNADRIFFIGDSEKQMNRSVQIYSKLLSARGIKTPLIPITAHRYELRSVLDLYKNILSQDDDFIFDITGGSELHIMAFGMIYRENLDAPSELRKNISIRRFNVRTGVLSRPDPSQIPPSKPDISLSVDENIQLYGGRVIHETSRGLNFDSDFTNDIHKMSQYIVRNRENWNLQTGYLAYGSGEDLDNDRLTSSYTLNSINFVGRYDKESHKRFLKFLSENGFITEFKQHNLTVSFKYKNRQVKRCLNTSGLVLELYIYLTAKSLKDRKGKSIFTDAAVGAVIDWDSAPSQRGRPNVTNEIDVMLMRGAYPVFISCKNGYVDTEELYKLRTVADEFGGKYARAVLVCPELASGRRDNAEKIVRAEELGIEVIRDIRRSELMKRLKSL